MSSGQLSNGDARPLVAVDALMSSLKISDRDARAFMPPDDDAFVPLHDVSNGCTRPLVPFLQTLVSLYAVDGITRTFVGETLLQTFVSLDAVDAIAWTFVGEPFLQALVSLDAVDAIAWTFMG